MTIAKTDHIFACKNIAGSTTDAVAQTLNQGTELFPWTIADLFQRGQRGINSVWVFSRLDVPIFASDQLGRAKDQGQLATLDFASDLLVGIILSGGLK